MSEASIPNPERWKRLVLVLTLINTVLASVIAGLGADAGIRSAQSNRDSQYFAVLASASLFKTGLQSTYDLNTFADVLKNTQESLVMQYTALQEEQKGDKDGAAASQLQGTVAQARADKARSLSIFYTDPRYAPATDQDAPKFDQYMKDSDVEAQALVAKQNAASDEYRRWNTKSDSYVAVLSILAIAFFLLGVAQMIAARLRLLFASFAVAVMGLAGLWTLAVLLG